jgi:hypothetical protein
VRARWRLLYFDVDPEELKRRLHERNQHDDANLGGHRLEVVLQPNLRKEKRSAVLPLRSSRVRDGAGAVLHSLPVTLIPAGRRVCWGAG